MCLVRTGKKLNIWLYAIYFTLSRKINGKKSNLGEVDYMTLFCKLFFFYKVTIF